MSWSQRDTNPARQDNRVWGMNRMDNAQRMNQSAHHRFIRRNPHQVVFDHGLVIRPELIAQPVNPNEGFERVPRTIRVEPVTIIAPPDIELPEMSCTARSKPEHLPILNHRETHSCTDRDHPDSTCERIPIHDLDRSRMNVTDHTIPIRNKSQHRAQEIREQPAIETRQID